MTEQDKIISIYNIIHSSIRRDAAHLGKEKANHLANIAAVKSTWYVYNDPKQTMYFVDSVFKHAERSFTWLH
jgi:hypothetical protein